MCLQSKQRLFNVKDYYRMAKTHIFSPEEKLELLEGVIFERPRTGNRRAACIRRLNVILYWQLHQQVIISIHNPLRLSDYSEPEPDLVLLKWRHDFYADGHPTAKHTLLVIEVADTTISYDRDFKMPLYARAKIPQAMLVNLTEDTVELYSKPVKGKYTKTELLRRGDALSLQSFPDISFMVDEILG